MKRTVRSTAERDDDGFAPPRPARCTHPEIPIHNNVSELQLRRPVVGRKNWLFAGFEGGARSAATLLSLIGSCRLHDLDPWEYLHALLGGINDQPVNRVGEMAPVHAARATVVAE